MTSIVAFGYGPTAKAGMGIVLAELLPRLQTMGYDVTWVAKGGGPEEYEGVNVVPTPPVQNAGDRQILQNVLYKVQPDVFLTNLNWQGIQNIDQVLNPYYQNTGDPLHTILHTPIESEEAPPGFQQRVIDGHLNPVHLIPFTRPSMEMFPDEFNSKAWCMEYVPHGVSSVFRSPPHRRGFLGQFDDSAKWVVVNAGNERRKNLDRWLRAAGEIKDRYDGEVRFAMHSSPEPKRGDPLWGGWELPRVASSEGLEPQSDIYWTKEYAMQSVPAEQIDSLYGDADLYMSLSGGEGFGLPVAEALVRETACLLTQHMNHEFVAGPGAEYVPAAEDFTRMRTAEKLLLPDPDLAAEMAVDLLEDDDRRERMAAEGADHAEKWRWEKAIQRLLDYMEEEVLD